jgi:hypothetical protein
VKRFTDTEKWRDPWYRRLPPRLKCLWQYLCDTCDAAGVFEPDWEQASFVIGEPVTLSDLDEFKGRLEVVVRTKMVILKFVPFQYSNLSHQCPAHKPVFSAMRRSNIGYQYPNDRVTVGYSIPTGKVQTGKDNEQERKGDAAEPCWDRPVATTSLAVETTELRAILCPAFKRTVNAFDYEEERLALTVVRARPAWQSEIKEMLEYREKTNGRFVPLSVNSFLEGWSRILDAARNWKDTRKPSEKTLLEKEVERECRQIHNGNF